MESLSLPRNPHPLFNLLQQKKLASLTSEQELSLFERMRRIHPWPNLQLLHREGLLQQLPMTTTIISSLDLEEEKKKVHCSMVAVMIALPRCTLSLKKKKERMNPLTLPLSPQALDQLAHYFKEGSFPPISQLNLDALLHLAQEMRGVHEKGIIEEIDRHLEKLFFSRSSQKLLQMKKLSSWIHLLFPEQMELTFLKRSKRAALLALNPLIGFQQNPPIQSVEKELLSLFTDWQRAPQPRRNFTPSIQEAIDRILLEKRSQNEAILLYQTTFARMELQKFLNQDHLQLSLKDKRGKERTICCPRLQLAYLTPLLRTIISSPWHDRSIGEIKIAPLEIPMGNTTLSINLYEQFTQLKLLQEGRTSHLHLQNVTEYLAFYHFLAYHNALCYRKKIPLPAPSQKEIDWLNSRKMVKSQEEIREILLFDLEERGIFSLLDDQLKIQSITTALLTPPAIDLLAWLAPKKIIFDNPISNDDLNEEKMSRLKTLFDRLISERTESVDLRSTTSFLREFLPQIATKAPFLHWLRLEGDLFDEGVWKELFFFSGVRELHLTITSCSLVKKEEINLSTLLPNLVEISIKIEGDFNKLSKQAKIHHLHGSLIYLLTHLPVKAKLHLHFNTDIDTIVEQFLIQLPTIHQLRSLTSLTSFSYKTLQRISYSFPHLQFLMVWAIRPEEIFLKPKDTVSFPSLERLISINLAPQYFQSILNGSRLRQLTIAPSKRTEGYIPFLENYPSLNKITFFRYGQISERWRSYMNRHKRSELVKTTLSLPPTISLNDRGIFHLRTIQRKLARFLEQDSLSISDHWIHHSLFFYTQYYQEIHPFQSLFYFDRELVHRPSLLINPHMISLSENSLLFNLFKSLYRIPQVTIDDPFFQEVMEEYFQLQQKMFNMIDRWFAHTLGELFLPHLEEKSIEAESKKIFLQKSFQCHLQTWERLSHHDFTAALELQKKGQEIRQGMEERFNRLKLSAKNRQLVMLSWMIRCKRSLFQKIAERLPQIVAGCSPIPEEKDDST